MKYELAKKNNKIKRTGVDWEMLKRMYAANDLKEYWLGLPALSEGQTICRVDPIECKQESKKLEIQTKWTGELEDCCALTIKEELHLVVKKEYLILKKGNLCKINELNADRTEGCLVQTSAGKVCLGGEEKKIEILDEEWQFGPKMTKTRKRPGVLVQNNTKLVVFMGMWDSQFLSDFEVVDLIDSKPKFKAFDFKGKIPLIRSFGFIPIRKDCYLLLGGLDKHSNINFLVYTFDLENRTVRESGSYLCAYSSISDLKQYNFEREPLFSLMPQPYGQDKSSFKFGNLDLNGKMLEYELDSIYD